MLRFLGVKGKQDSSSKGEAALAAGIVETAVKVNQKAGLLLVKSGVSYQTFFTGCHTAARFEFFLDPPVPAPAAGILIPDETVATVSFELATIPYHVDATFGGEREWGGRRALMFHTPLAMRTVQNRRYYRVEPRITRPVTVHVTSPKPEESVVINISEGGIKFKTAENFSMGQKVTVTLNLPTLDELLVGIELEVVGFGRLDAIRKQKNLDQPYYVRCQFAAMPVRTAQLINAYVVDRQRETLKFFA